MKILTSWLRTYVSNIPADDHQLAEDLTLRGIAVEGVHVLGLGNGHLFEMDITTNRVDAMNHYGIAREAATIYNLPLSAHQNDAVILNAVKYPRISPEAAQASAGTPTPFPVRIEAPELCGRFTAQVLRNVTIAPSTGQVADYFQLLGQKQISNAVDASNFVLLGMGQPTHAFDLDKIRGGLVVRLARQGETIKLLDGTDRTLETDDLVVADESKPLALAGVMGGYDSMITPETRNILVEAAWFDPASIRRSARRHSLHTDASHRFERGADFNGCPIANRLVSGLILQNGGQADGDLIDIVIPEIAARTANRPPVALSVKQVQRHLGATTEDTPTRSALTDSLIHQYLTALGCTLTAVSAGVKKTGMVNPLATKPSSSKGDAADLPGSVEAFQVRLPSWRLDLEREIDLIEEVARVYGYNRFANTLPAPGIVLAHPLAQKEAAVRGRLLALGFSESISTTFASQADGELFYTAQSAKVHIPNGESTSVHRAPQTVPLANPLSEEAFLLRPSLVPGMVTMLGHNLNRDVREVRLFEQGHIFTGSLSPDSDSIDAVHETAQLALGLTSGSARATPLYSAEDAPFFELKGAIESVLSLFDAGAGGTVSFSPEEPSWIEAGRGATAWMDGRPIAWFGELSTAETQRRKLRQAISLAQLDLEALYRLPLKSVMAHDLSRFQAVERDFSFTFPDAMRWEKIASAIQRLDIAELRRLSPTEIFRDPKGRSVPPGHYALLLKCVFQSYERTLKEDELTSWWSRIISTLTGLGGVIRAPAEK